MLNITHCLQIQIETDSILCTYLVIENTFHILNKHTLEYIVNF